MVFGRSRYRVGVAALLVACMTAGPALAEFTFKRIKPPDPNSKDKINIQTLLPATLPPPEPGIPEIEEASLSPLPPAPIDVAEFWAAISPEISAADSRRLEEIAALFHVNPDLAAQYRSSRSSMERIAANYGDEIAAATINRDISPALVLAVIGVESAGNSTAVSHAGASGLMQLMPGTAKRFGVDDTTDPAQNIDGGVAYLDWLLDQFGQDPVLALAGYNAGENAVIRSGGVPPYDETRAYVPKVAAAWAIARSLCVTPPIDARGECEFKVE